MCTCVVKGDSGDVISSHMDGSFSVPQVSELITNIPSELMFERIITWISFVWEHSFLYSTCNISILCMCQFWRVEEFFSLNTASFKDQ